MAKKKYSITVAGGGSYIYTRYRIDAFRSYGQIPNSFHQVLLITMQRDRKQLQKHVRSI